MLLNRDCTDLARCQKSVLSFLTRDAHTYKIQLLDFIVKMIFILLVDVASKFTEDPSLRLNSAVLVLCRY